MKILQNKSGFKILFGLFLIVGLVLAFRWSQYQYRVGRLNSFIKMGDAESVLALIHQNPELTEVDLMKFGGWHATPLLVSISLGQEKVCSVLLQAGANVNARDKAGNAAIHKAIRSGNTNIIADLIRHGADTELKDGMGEKPIDLADSMNLSPEVKKTVRELLTAKGGVRQ